VRVHYERACTDLHFFALPCTRLHKLPQTFGGEFGSGIRMAWVFRGHPRLVDFSKCQRDRIKPPGLTNPVSRRSIPDSAPAGGTSRAWTRAGAAFRPGAPKAERAQAGGGESRQMSSNRDDAQRASSRLRCPGLPQRCPSHRRPRPLRWPGMLTFSGVTEGACLQRLAGLLRNAASAPARRASQQLIR
jgi:hypothetical protein